MDRIIRIGIIGCGLIGQKRAGALKQIKKARLVFCADPDVGKAKQAAALFEDCCWGKDWEKFIHRDDLDGVFVSTPHYLLAPISIAAIRAGKHVLVEKPGARNAREIQSILNASRKNKALVRVGFNHRYHPAFLKMRQLLRDNKLGLPMYIRARYGHGGRLGYHREWRADRRLSGGGELIDQGLHLIDLSRSFLGDFSRAQGFIQTYFWPMKVEDNAFLMLQTPQRQTAFLHASWTEWKNLFCFELFTQKAKLVVDGLGGSYQTERLTYYQMLPRMGPPRVVSWDFPGEDLSWKRECQEFLEDLRRIRQPSVSLEDALKAMRVAEKIYHVNKIA